MVQQALSDHIRRTSLVSVLAATDGAEILLSDLCTKIATFEALDRAIIVASECYVTKTVVRHRYIIMELFHSNLAFWVRLDRRRSGSGILPFIFASSTTPSRDTVRISIPLSPSHQLTILRIIGQNLAL